MATLFGVNVPYLYGDYGHDLARNPRFPDWPTKFTATSAYRPLIEARRLGFGAVRTWLCENAEGIVIDDAGHVTGVHPDLVEAVKILGEAAHLHGIAVYWCLLDGNASAREGDVITRSILADADQAARFAEHVVAPLVAAMAPEVTLGVDVVNEPESSTANCIEDPAVPAVPWESIGRTIRLAKQAVLAEHDVWVTAGTMHVFLPHLLRSGADVTAIDVHVYHPSGGLPSREDLARYAGPHPLFDARAPLIGGELGAPKPADENALCNYVHNARTLEYDAAFLWQLEGDLVDKTATARPWTPLGEAVESLLR
jgi:hypothetical protein